MATFKIRQDPLFDLVSHGRGGPRESGRHFTPAQVEQIRRTVQRAPEAVVKVLPRASNDLKAVGKHLDYIGRNGKLELETDDGERMSGRSGKALLETGISTSTMCAGRRLSLLPKAEVRRN